MKNDGAFWRLTFRMTVNRPDMKSTFTKHGTAVPGTRAQAIRHLRSIYHKMWPSAKIRLMSATPDHKASSVSQKGAK